MSPDDADRVRPARVLRAAALPGLRLAEDEAGGEPADTPHTGRSGEITSRLRARLAVCFEKHLTSVIIFAGFWAAAAA